MSCCCHKHADDEEELCTMIVCGECGDKRCPKAQDCDEACQEESRSDLDDLRCDPGPCAKTVVSCKIIAPRGEVFIGTNECDNPQAVCPRLPGEDYTKCETICQQKGHAEVQALALAGDEARQSVAILEGHSYICADCQHALNEAGVSLYGVR